MEKRAHSDDSDEDVDERRKLHRQDSSAAGLLEPSWAPVNSPVQPEIDETFYDLCRSFAKIELPNVDPNAPESCPICNEKFPLSQFAVHVYECIKVLDKEEQRAQEQLDAKLAERLSNEIGENEEIEARFSKPVFCAKGNACTRTDAQHFEQLRHPLVECPICNNMLEVYLINAHVTMCMDSGPNMSPFSHVGRAPAANPAASSSFMSPVPAPRFDRRRSPAGIEDSDSDADKGMAGSPASAAAAAVNTSADSPRLRRMGTANGGLSQAQMRAMALMVCEQKDSAAAGGGANGGAADVSLLQLLDTFKQFGFDKNSLSAQLKRIESDPNMTGAGNDAAAASSSSSSVPPSSVSSSSSALIPLPNFGASPPAPHLP